MAVPYSQFCCEITKLKNRITQLETDVALLQAAGGDPPENLFLDPDTLDYYVSPEGDPFVYV